MLFPEFSNMGIIDDNEDSMIEMEIGLKWKLIYILLDMLNRIFLLKMIWHVPWQNKGLQMQKRLRMHWWIGILLLSILVHIKDFAENSGLEIITNNDFCERKVGEWVEDFRGFSEKQWQDFDFKLLGGESLREVQERNIAALFDVIRNNLGENVVIGTHGTALSTIINYFNPNFEYADFWRIVDKMPYILCFIFNDIKLESIEEVEFTLM